LGPAAPKDHTRRCLSRLYYRHFAFLHESSIGRQNWKLQQELKVMMVTIRVREVKVNDNYGEPLSSSVVERFGNRDPAIKCLLAGIAVKKAVADVLNIERKIDAPNHRILY
jgi:hypothetical protein